VRKLVVIALGLMLAAFSAFGDDLASRVVILANADDADSIRIARHYAEQRGIPELNIVALPMPLGETISWKAFSIGIWQPLQKELLARAWMDAIPMSLIDSVGRRRFAPAGHRISYLVVCRGVPLRINHDPMLLTELKGPANRPELLTNHSAVDAELSLLAFGDYEINSYVPNPLFRVVAPSTLVAETIIKVSRLDGPSVKDVLRLIDETMAAEKTGLIGRAYIDVKGPYPQGNDWMERAIIELESIDLKPSVNRQSGTFGVDARIDMPAVYAGWYAGNLNGPFALPEFRFAPGAVAVHIHSYSAQTMRSDTSGWCGPLIARGAAVTTGAVFEPYLPFMHHPQMLIERLAAGANVGDAASYSLPVLSWQNILIGDPLYRPFKRTLEDQWEHRAEVSARLLPYVVLRQVQHLVAKGDRDGALALARLEQAERPSLAVGLELAEMLTKDGDFVGAAQAVGFAPHLRSVSSNEWALLESAAEMLKAAGGYPSALQIYTNLLALERVPEGLRKAWLTRAIRTANEAGNLSLSLGWERELTQLPSERKNRADRSPPERFPSGKIRSNLVDDLIG